MAIQRFAGDMTTAIQPMISTGEYARLFGLHQKVVQLKCARGEIPAVKIAANRWRIPRDYVDSMLRCEQPHTPAQRRAALLGDDVVAAIKELVADAPPLTDAQKDAIRAAFRNGSALE
jgi:hypothetical protein